jgi:cobalt/nickel transport system ATP-binding protein
MTQTNPLVEQTVSLNQEAAAVHVKELWFSYPDKPNVLQNINLQIQPGERVGVVGPNGSGKTTLFMSLCGVLVPASGEITVFGEPIVSGAFRPDIGLVFQNPDDQLFSASVWDDVAFGPQNMGLPPEEVQQRVTEALRLTGMQTLAHRPPHHLSGGEKRMVAIAGILAMHPKVVIYDEPSANLDLRARRRLIQFLCQSEQTLIISAHDLECILEVCDRVILIDEGQIIADGDPGEIMSDAALMQAHGLEKPHSLMPHVEPHHL